MVSVSGFLQSHVLPCKTINMIKCLVKFIHENYIIIACSSNPKSKKSAPAKKENMFICCLFFD